MTLAQPVSDTTTSGQPFVFPQRVIQTDINGNGISFNTDNLTAITSGTYTSNQTSSDLTNYTAKGVVVFISPGTVTGVTATVTIRGKDPVSGNYYNILQSATIATNTFQTLTVYPGNTVTANVSASTVLPKTWDIQLSGTGWGSITTLSVAYCLMM
jgi:hypothetical protein